MMARVYRLLASLRRMHAEYQHRHAAYRSQVLYEQYANASRDLSAALFAEQQAANKLEAFGSKSADPAEKPLFNHNYRRKVVLEFVCIYGVFIALCVWNWW